MNSSAFNDSDDFGPKQTGNGNKVNCMEKISFPHSADGHTDLTTSSSSSRKLDHKHIGHGPLPFPFKLHFMLDDVEQRGIQQIVSWMPSGRAFKVHKPPEFIADVVPCYFNLTKYKSFKRQLINYGFKRIEERGGVPRDVIGPAFHHPHFIRDDPDSCRLIIRGEKCSVNHNSPETSESKYQIDSCPLDKRSCPLDQEGPRIPSMLPSTLPPPQALATRFEKIVDPRRIGIFDEQDYCPKRLPQLRANVDRLQPGGIDQQEERSQGRTASVFGGAQSKMVAKSMISRQPLQYVIPSDIVSGLDLDQVQYSATSSSSLSSMMIQSLVQEGGANAETIEWLFSGAVSLPDLDCVLETYSGGSSSTEEGKQPHQPPRNQNALFRAEQRDLPFQEDIISLFRNATSG